MAQSIVKHCIKKRQRTDITAGGNAKQGRSFVYEIQNKSKFIEVFYSNDFQSLCVHSHLKEYKLYQRKRSQL